MEIIENQALGTGIKKVRSPEGELKPEEEEKRAAPRSRMGEHPGVALSGLLS